jgi:hypothetical protein
LSKGSPRADGGGTGVFSRRLSGPEPGVGEVLGFGLSPGGSRLLLGARSPVGAELLGGGAVQIDTPRAVHAARGGEARDGELVQVDRDHVLVEVARARPAIPGEVHLEIGAGHRAGLPPQLPLRAALHDAVGRPDPRCGERDPHR